MIRKSFLQISNGFASLFEGGIQEKEIISFCTSEYKRINAANNKPNCVKRELDEIGELHEKMGWLESERKKTHPKDTTQSHIEPADLQKWMTFLETHEVIENGIIFVGSSFFLDALDKIHEKKGIAFIKNNLEKLLRHTEVLREKSLSNYSVSLTHDQAWLERYDTSILFSRFARRHTDLRFLNAAFKLNDWFFEKEAGRKTLECRTRFVLALSEQEYTSMELLK